MVPSRLSRRPSWSNSATHSKRMVQPRRCTRAPVPVFRRSSGTVALVGSEDVLLESGLQQNDSAELPDNCKAGGSSAAEGTEPAPPCASTLVAVCCRVLPNDSAELPVTCKAGRSSATEGTEPCLARQLGLLPGRILPRTANEWLNLAAMRKHLPWCAGGRHAVSRKFARKASCSNAGSDVPRVTRLNGGTAAAPLVCTRRLHGAEPVISEAFLVEFCHAQQTNG